jgi:hypothetical protein
MFKLSFLLPFCSRVRSGSDIRYGNKLFRIHNIVRDFILTALCRTNRLAPLSIPSSSSSTVLYKISRNRDKPVSIDEVDRGVLHLKASMDNLAGQVAAREERLRVEAAAVKEHLRTGRRLRAKSCLQRQKRLERSLAALLSQQANLETVYEEILHAETNSKVVR